MSLIIIFGDVGVGKTSMMSAMLSDIMIYDRQRYLNCCIELDKLNANGYHISKPKREHCVSCNYDLIAYNEYCSGKMAYHINPFEFVLPNEDIVYKVIQPYGAYGITEAQAVYNARKSKQLRDCVSRLYENYRHDHLDIYLDCQRFDLIDLNIRFISDLFYVVDQQHKKDWAGNVIATMWTYYSFENYKIVESFVNSGFKDFNLGKKHTYTFVGNIYEHYNSYCNQSAFYDFDKSKPVDWDADEDNYKGVKLLDNNNFWGTKC